MRKTAMLLASMLAAGSLSAAPAGGAAVPPAPQADGVRVYYFGNSLTGSTAPELHTALGKSAGREWIWDLMAVAGGQLWQYRDQFELDAKLGPVGTFTLDALLPEIEREPKYQRSPGAVPECVGVEDGDPWHDLRPCAFAVGQWLPVFHGLGLRRHHLTWSVRGGNGVANISDMPLGGGAVADIEFDSGSSTVCGVKIDGAPVRHTLVLPWSELSPGRHRIEVGGQPSPSPILVDADAKLLSVETDGRLVRYHLSGHGPHKCRFADGRETIVNLDGTGILEEPLA